MDSTTADSTLLTESTEYRIFQVAELLEAILHELPMKDLRLTWECARRGSRLLSTRKGCKKTSSFSQTESRNLSTRSSGMMRTVSTSAKEMSSVLMTIMNLGEDSITAITNALLKGFIGAVLIGKGSLEGSGGICVSTYISGANPSWAHMLLKQPPISNFTTILNFYKYATPISFRQQSGNVESRGGIRLGDFLKILKKLHGHDRWTFQGFQTDRSDLLAFDFVISDEKEYERVADGRIGGLFPAMTTYCYW